MSLTNPTNVVTEQRLAEFYQAIFPYLGGYGGTGIDYTETERVVGTWVDGKPLYQKVITGLNLTLSWKGQYHASGDMTSPIADVDKLVFAYAMASGGNVVCGAIKIVSDVLDIVSVDSYTITTLVAQYTKTTDTAGTKKYLGVPAVHYTTDEQVIGTWIDGKPLYQSVVTFQITSNDGLTQVDHHISNISQVCLADLYIIDGTSMYTSGYKNGGAWGSTANVTTSVIKLDSNGLKNKTAMMILKYTKTTD